MRMTKEKKKSSLFSAKAALLFISCFCFLALVNSVQGSPRARLIYIDNNANQSSISIGQNKSEVSRQLGMPAKKILNTSGTKENIESWHYPEIVVIFKNDSVIAWSNKLRPRLAKEAESDLGEFRMEKNNALAKQNSEAWSKPWSRQKPVDQKQVLQEIIEQIESRETAPAAKKQPR